MIILPDMRSRSDNHMGIDPGPGTNEDTLFDNRKRADGYVCCQPGPGVNDRPVVYHSIGLWVNRTSDAQTSLSCTEILPEHFHNARR